MSKDDGDGWAKVKWEHNDVTNGYRIGKGGFHDLKVGGGSERGGGHQYGLPGREEWEPLRLRRSQHGGPPNGLAVRKQIIAWEESVNVGCVSLWGKDWG